MFNEGINAEITDLKEKLVSKPKPATSSTKAAPTPPRVTVAVPPPEEEEKEKEDDSGVEHHGDGWDQDTITMSEQVLTFFCTIDFLQSNKFLKITT